MKKWPPIGCSIGALVTVVAVPLLGACGFHLAGTRPLPDVLNKVYIDVATPYRVSETPLEVALRTRLLRQGAEVLKDDSGASATIKLTRLQEGQQVLSIGPDGKAQEFLLITSVDYEVRAGGQPLIPPGSLRVSRDYSFNQDQILAKEAEEARLREYIQDELAELLLLKVETQLARNAASPQKMPARVVPPVNESPAQPVPGDEAAKQARPEPAIGP